jgi:hypothetical protein
MTPLRQHMSAALQRSGTSARTQPSSVREVRLLAQFSGTSPHLSSASELQQDILHRKNVDHLAPTSMRLCSRGLRFFSLPVLERAGQLLASCELQPHTGSPLSSVCKKSVACSAWPPPCTPVCTFPPSRAWDSDCTKDSCAQFLPSTANDAWATCIGARGPRTAPSPALQSLEPAGDTPGQHPAIPPGFFPPLAVSKSPCHPPPTPCIAAASKAPSAKPNHALVS